MVKHKEEECVTLKNSLVSAQEKLNLIKKQNDALIGKYRKAQNEIAAYRDGTVKKAFDRVPQPVDIPQFKVNNYQRELNIRNNESLRLKGMVEEKSERLKAMAGAHEYYKERTRLVFQDVDDKDQSIEKLKKRVEELREELEELREKRKVEGTAFTEVERLRADNEKLVRMLATKRGHRDTQKQEWTPQDAFKLARDVLHKGGEFDEEKMNALLVNLNRIWSERGARQMERVQQEYSTEVANLKREGMMSNGFNEVDAKREMGRLRSDLSTVYKDLKDNIVARRQSEDNPHKTNLVGESLKQSSKLQNERKRLNNENTRLKAQVEKLKKEVNLEDNSKYMEGATWMVGGLDNEVSDYVKAVDRLCEEHVARKREKEARGNIDSLTISQLNAELVEKLEEAAYEFKERMHEVVESVNSQERKLKQMVKQGAKEPAKCTFPSQRLDY
eukprot:TRINITY_DN9695_c0_g2_i16.p1 TRINITY_DN9695_c0_g2~~TRINITY_DN9695_c0_g2_i16.p1  ORF type:complete len:445 (+),score=143.83 TRINITY_DN9695_c0_g2_i16:354-1688(+)